MQSEVTLITLVQIDLIKGKTNVDLDSLSKILLDNYNNKFDCEIDSTFSEDSICPPNEILDDIIDQMKVDFYEILKLKVFIEF